MQYRAMLAATVAAAITCGCALPTEQRVYPGLESTSWKLLTVSGRQLDIPAKPPIELRFLESRVNLHGCNALSGRYAQEGDRIIVAKGFVGTRMRCNPELMAIDAAATSLFEQGVRFRLVENNLVLERNGERWEFERTKSM